jgi:hypothetical protein
LKPTDKGVGPANPILDKRQSSHFECAPVLVHHIGTQLLNEEFYMRENWVENRGVKKTKFKFSVKVQKKFLLG